MGAYRLRIVREKEDAEHSPYLRIRIGRIVAVYGNKGGEGVPSESSKALDGVLGRIKVAWADGPGGRDMVPLTFSSFSNPVSSSDKTNPLAKTTARCYGDISLPSPGDLVVVGFRAPEAAVVIGYLPANYFQQTSTDASKPNIWGTMRAVKPGEFSRLSGQQAELYHDQAGAIQIVVKAQPAKSAVAPVPKNDGSDTSILSDIDPTTVPTTELARVTVGEAYSDETFTHRAVNSLGKKVILRVTTKSGAAVNIDTDGNVSVTAATSKSLILNGGNAGVARLADQTKSTTTEDQNFWGFMSAFAQAFQNWTPSAGDGGAALKAQLATVFAQYPQAPSSLTAKITTSSTSVLAGN